MTPRPLKQLRILDALREAYARDGRLPDLAELARRFEIRYTTLREHLAALEAKGYLRITSRGPGRSPDVRLLGSVGDDEATLKYLDRTGTRPTHYRLRPHNPGYTALEVPASEVHVDGVFRGLLRGPVVQELMIAGENAA